MVRAREVEGMSEVEGMTRTTLEKEAGDAMGLGLSCGARGSLQKWNGPQVSNQIQHPKTLASESSQTPPLRSFECRAGSPHLLPPMILA